MCAEGPTIRSRSSPWRPVISASAISSAITPTITPRIEMKEMSEMNACFRRASRYRVATNSSKGSSMRFAIMPRGSRKPCRVELGSIGPSGGCATVYFWFSTRCRQLRALRDLESRSRSSSRTHQRKEDDVADRRTVGQQHHEPIDAHALSGGRRQPVLERTDVVLVHRMRLADARCLHGEL